MARHIIVIAILLIFPSFAAAQVLVGADASGGPHVRVFSGSTSAQLPNFFAYDASFTGGVRVASGDTTGDGIPDIITGAGPGGGPHVRVFDGTSGADLFSFFAFDTAFTGGVRVGAGDVNNDGFADIITGAGPGGGPHVRVFSGQTGELLREFDAFSTSFSGGVFVASGLLIPEPSCLALLFAGLMPFASWRSRSRVA